MEKIKKENEIKMNILREENLVKLKEQEELKKQNELLAAQEKNNLLLKKNDLELKNNRSKDEEIKKNMDDLFNVQKNLLKNKNHY